MENILEFIRQDLLSLAEEHAVTASNEHLWALGSDDPESAAQHEQYAEEHRELAEMYRKMAEKALTIVEQFGGI